MMHFAVCADALDIAALRETLRNPDHGGFCAFEGWVRNNNEGRDVDGLEYEVYTELAQTEGERILAEARQRFGDIGVSAAHRSGMLRVGELAVWVGVSAAHRDEAFRACRYIIDEIKHRLPVWKKEHYLTGDTAWVACAHDHDHVHGDAPRAFVPDYSRQTRLNDVGERGQSRLTAAQVLVIGAGGLGSPVLAYLAGAGVGTLGIVDDDNVEASNLHRQTLYTSGDVGQPKAQLAARRVRSVNPVVNVEVIGERLTADTAAAVFSRFDLIIECTDDMRSRYLSSDAAVITGKPLILASVHQYEGQLQVIDPRSGGPCLRCLWPDEPAPGVAGSCADSGVLGPVPGVLGALQANEALKLLLGLPRPPDASLLLVDLLDNTTRRLAIDVREGCITRGGCADVARLALEAARTAADSDVRFDTLDAAVHAGFRLVDIRDDGEIEADPLSAPSQWLPATQLPARADELPNGARVLLVCATGRRSAHAARQLRAAGKRDIFSLTGGVRALRSTRSD